MQKYLSPKNFSFRNYKTNAAIKNEFIDIKYDLRAYTITKSDTNKDIINQIINNYKKQAEKIGYRGFSDEINSIHDPTSSYIYVADRFGNILSSVRCTLQKKQLRIPIEFGTIEKSNDKYIINENLKVCELNTFYYTQYRSVPTLYDALVRYIHLNNIDKIFALHNPENRTLATIYFSIGFYPSNKYKKPIFFETYEKKDNNNNEYKSAKWNILEMNASEMQKTYPRSLL